MNANAEAPARLLTNEQMDALLQVVKEAGTSPQYLLMWDLAQYAALDAEEMEQDYPDEKYGPWDIFNDVIGRAYDDSRSIMVKCAYDGYAECMERLYGPRPE